MCFSSWKSHLNHALPKYCLEEAQDYSLHFCNPLQIQQSCGKKYNQIHPLQLHFELFDAQCLIQLKLLQQNERSKGKTFSEKVSTLAKVCQARALQRNDFKQSPKGEESNIYNNI